jgi:hypothetical protein
MKKLMAIVVVSSIVAFCVACVPEKNQTDSSVDVPVSSVTPLLGSWIIDVDGDVMFDPQTSGLKYDNGYLYSLSDASADASQILRLHQISLSNSQIIKKIGPTIFSERVKSSCFYNYLANKPDYEGLAPIRGEDGAWIFVTEDASRSTQLTKACQKTYTKTGSTVYPTLLVRLQVKDENLEVTHVRPVQFSVEANVGDFPNDGIEGLAFTKDNRLLLGLERDANKQPRVFEISVDDNFWQESGFAKVRDSQLWLPNFEQGNHPINAMDVFYPTPSSQGYLLAAARNDNELWIVDLAKRKPTKRIKLAFSAPSAITQDENQRLCEKAHLMNNASIEGVAVVDDHVWMVNDPWKVNYLKNIVCPADKDRYQKMAPLLFKIKIDDAWFD